MFATIAGIIMAIYVGILTWLVWMFVMFHTMRLIVPELVAGMTYRDFVKRITFRR